MRPPSPRPSPLSAAQDQLQVFRLRMRNGLEIVAAPADDCFIIVIQRWVVGSGGVGSGIEESDGATGAT